MTGVAAEIEGSPARRRFLRQGQLAATAIGGIVVAVIVGLLPPRMSLVPISPELGAVHLEDIAIWLVPLVIGMAAGYVGWIVVVERRRPGLRGHPWSGERDWAITGGMLVAYVLVRALGTATGERASGLYSTGDEGLFLLVDAPIDIAMVMIRFLASAAIAAVLLRLVFDWRAARRTAAS